MLSVADYDRAEAIAVTHTCYPALRAFRPAAFAMANFPARVSDEVELIRYCDIMHELTDEDAWYRGLRYSATEQRLIAAMSATVERLTGDLFGVPVVPFMCLFPPIPMLRAVEALAAGRRARILEIGPGAGYLGAYLLMRGHQYAATDNAQALYLWQHRLFSRLAETFVDQALDAAAAPFSSHASLIPWWRFAEIYKAPPPVDLVICDAAMGEMDVFAVSYIIRLAAIMLRESPVGAFLFQNIGEWRVNTLPDVESRFDAAGFVREQHDGVTVCSLRPVKFPAALPPVGGPQDLRTGAEFIHIARNKLLPSYDFFDFLNLHDR